MYREYGNYTVVLCVSFTAQQAHDREEFLVKLRLTQMGELWGVCSDDFLAKMDNVLTKRTAYKTVVYSFSHQLFGDRKKLTPFHAFVIVNNVSLHLPQGSDMTPISHFTQNCGIIFLTNWYRISADLPHDWM